MPNVQMTATLTDNASNPLPNQTVTFSYKLSSDTVFTNAGSTITNASGIANLTVSLMAPNIYDLDATYNGNSMYAAYNVAIVFDTTVSGGTQTSLTISVTTTLAGNTVTANVTGTLKDVNGVDVSGQVIQVSLDGVMVGSTNPTDSNGKFAFQITGIAFGTHTIAGLFQGNATYASSQATSQFTTGVSAGISPLAVVGIVAVGVVGTVLAWSRKRRKR